MCYSERTHSGCRRFLVHGRVGERVGRHGQVVVLVWAGGRAVVAEVHGRVSSGLDWSGVALSVWSRGGSGLAAVGEGAGGAAELGRRLKLGTEGEPRRFCAFLCGEQKGGAPSWKRFFNPSAC
jgi:hypothetical protein